MRKKTLLFFNSIFVVLLILSYLSVYVNPIVFWPYAFLGLLYPVWLLFNILFILYWLIQGKGYFLLSLIVVLIGFRPLQKLWQWSSGSEGASSGEKVKVMTYNVRLFDLYNWSENESTRDEMMALIAGENPEIVCLQEFFYSSQKDYFTTLDTLNAFPFGKHNHIDITKVVKEKYFFGMATFSSRPIVNKGTVQLTEGGNNSCLFSDIKVNEDTIRVYNVHLASVHLAHSEYEFLENLGQNTTKDKRWGQFKQIIKRLKKAFKKRALQAQEIMKHVKGSPHPVVVCGDFNDTPYSFTYMQFAAALKDAFLQGGRGWGATYSGILPFLRIDFIFHDSQITSSTHTIIREGLSDHYPVTCQLEVLEKE